MCYIRKSEYLRNTKHTNKTTMKKIFLTIIAAVAMVSMFASCQEKPEDEKDKEKEQEPTEAVTIDGNFADWAALKDVASAELDVDANAYPGMLAMKAYADETSIYVYFEYELQEETPEEGDPFIQTSAPFEIFVDSDGDATTGGSSWLWSEVGYEYMLEDETGFLGEGNTVRDMAETMHIYHFDGVDGKDAWEEGGHLTELELSAYAESAGTVKNGVATVEVALLRSVVNASKAGTIAIGIVGYDGTWKTQGVLPQGEAAGAVAMLDVTLP